MDFFLTDRIVLEEEIAPVILDIEEETKDQGEIHEADEDHHNHPTVQFTHTPWNIILEDIIEGGTCYTYLLVS